MLWFEKFISYLKALQKLIQVMIVQKIDQMWFQMCQKIVFKRTKIFIENLWYWLPQYTQSHITKKHLGIPSWDDFPKNTCSVDKFDEISKHLPHDLEKNFIHNALTKKIFCWEISCTFWFRELATLLMSYILGFT